MVVEVVVVVVVGNQRDRHRKRGENAGSRALTAWIEALPTWSAAGCLHAPAAQAFLKSTAPLLVL